MLRGKFCICCILDKTFIYVDSKCPKMQNFTKTLIAHVAILCQNAFIGNM